MDILTVWTAVGGIGAAFGGAGATAAALVARQGASESKRSSAIMLSIEQDRRYEELVPKFRVTWEPRQPSAAAELVEEGRLRVTLMGPVSLNHLDRLKVKVRDDHHRRGEQKIMLAGGPTREEVKAQIWGPYRLAPGVGPDGVEPDAIGRILDYRYPLPLSEELPFEMQLTPPPPWSMWSRTDWRKRAGDVIRLTFEAHRGDEPAWIIPCELDIGDGGKTVTVDVPPSQ